MKKKFLAILLAATLSVSTVAVPSMASAQTTASDTSATVTAMIEADTTDAAPAASTSYDTASYANTDNRLLQEGGLLSASSGSVNSKRTKKASAISSQTRQNVENMLSNTFDTFQTECDFSSLHISVSNFYTLFDDFINQHPRYFYVSGKTYYYYNDAREITTVHFSYKYTKSESQKMLSDYDDAVASALAGVDPLWSDMEKALYLNDYLATHCKYDGTYSKYSAYNCLVEKTSVCQGYSLAYQELLTDVGIPCQIVTSDSLNHAWNMLCIDGRYYYNDVTWNDPTPDREGRTRHFYLLKSENFYRSSAGKHLKKNDWLVSGSWNISDAADTSYDAYFWNDINTAFLPIQGAWYNFDGTDRIWKYTYSNKQFTPSQSLVTIDDVWYVTNKPGYFWKDKYIGFAAYDTNLYYSTPDKIYRLDPTTNTSTLIYEQTSSEKASGTICGLMIDSSGKLSYISSTNMSSYQKTFALQLTPSGNSNALKNTCYQICFNGNGAENGFMDTMRDCLFDQTYTLTANTFTRTGYTFTGWNTKADGTGTAYADGASVTGLSAKNYANITLYAQWTKNAGSDQPSTTDPSDTLTPSTPSNTTQSAIRLSTKKLTIKKGKTASLRLYNNAKKTTWSILSGKKYIALSNRSNAGVTIKARKKGTAKVQASVAGKKYTCTIRVK